MRCRKRHPEVTRAHNERMVDFMDKLQEKKSNAKAAYIKARNEWENIRTIEDIKGDFEKWKAFCERKRDCILLGVRI